MSGFGGGEQPSPVAVSATSRPLLPRAIPSWPPGGGAGLIPAPAPLASASGMPGGVGGDERGTGLRRRGRGWAGDRGGPRGRSYPSAGSCAPGAAGRGLRGASAGLLRDGSADAAHVIGPARKQPHVARLSPGTPPPLGRATARQPRRRLLPLALLGLVAASLPPGLNLAGLGAKSGPETSPSLLTSSFKRWDADLGRVSLREGSL